MNHPLRLPLALAALLAAGTLPAQAFDLVTKEEARRDAAAPDYATKTLPMAGAPTIELVAPDVKKPLSGAVNIVVRWAAADGASIDTRSFKLLYGRLRLDVTERIAGHAKITPTGLEAPNAELPEGSHRLTLQIADSLKRVGRHEVTVEVLPAK